MKPRKPVLISWRRHFPWLIRKVIKMNIKIHFIRADEYIAWKKNLQNFEEIVDYINKLKKWDYTLPYNRPLSDTEKDILLDFLSNMVAYLFKWDEVPGNDNEIFIRYIEKKFFIDWIKTAKIEKVDDGMGIKVSDEEKYLLLRLNNKKTKVKLKIYDGRTCELLAKTENGTLHIYNKTKLPPLGYVYYVFFHPASGEYIHDYQLRENTLHNLGVNDNDVMIVDWGVNIPTEMITGVRFAEELFQIFNMNNPNQVVVSIGDEHSPLAEILKSDKDKNPLYALLLYTDEDVDITKYVRTYYNELSKLSGKTRVFVFEEEHARKEVFQYWSKQLPNINEYIGWNALGLTKTKPYDKAQIYELCHIFGIPKERVPCILFFNNLELNDKKFVVLEFPKDEKLKDFFRHVFTLCDKAINVSPEKRIDFLASQFRKDKAKRIISRIIKSGIKDVLKKAVGI